jgi:hypothetical protein
VLFVFVFAGIAALFEAMPAAAGLTDGLAACGSVDCGLLPACPQPHSAAAVSAVATNNRIFVFIFI